MDNQQIEEELLKIGNAFNAAGLFLNQQLSGLEKDVAARAEKSKLFEEEYLLKQKRISSLYKSFKDEFLRHQLFKDAATFLVGFVLGLLATILFVILSTPQGAQPAKVIRKQSD